MEANRIITERKLILEQAQRDAQNIVEQAKNYIHKLTDENSITRQAQEQALKSFNKLVRLRGISSPNRWPMRTKSFPT